MRRNIKEKNTHTHMEVSMRLISLLNLFRKLNLNLLENNIEENFNIFLGLSDCILIVLSRLEFIE